MPYPKSLVLALCASCAFLLPPPALGQTDQTQVPPQPSATPDQAAPANPLGLRAEIEPQAIELLKAMGARLAAAKTMSFTASAGYESVARTGVPLLYTTVSEVTLQRPDRLRVVTPGDGPPSEFYYDGKVMMAYSPNENLVAVADAPPTIDAMLKAAYASAAIYFPFTDAIVADPYGDMADGLKLAFVVGKSQVVGGTVTDVVVVANDDVQEQIWIGAQDHLPRVMRAVFFNEPGQYRHVVEFSDWRLDQPVPPGTFFSDKASHAQRMKFEPPQAKLGQQPADPATNEQEKKQ